MPSIKSPFAIPRPKAWLMIAVLGFTAFFPILRLGFLWDDHVMIESNNRIRTWSVQGIKEDFTQDVFEQEGDPYYRPLQIFMNRVDYTLWGLNPAGYHFTNLLFHVGNAVLVLELALLLGCTPIGAFVAGSLFAVHPIGVEQLMIIAGRAELMSLFFSLIAILLLLRKERYGIALGSVSFILALLSKESAVMVPCLLMLMHYYRRDSKQKYKVAFSLCLILLPYFWLRHQAVGTLFPRTDWFLTLRFFVQEFPQVLFRYVGILLVPWNLHSHRLLPQINHFWPLTFLICLALSLFILRRYRHAGVLCFFWFVLCLLPRTPIMIFGNFMLDHWAYPSLVALLLPLAFLASSPRVRTSKVQRGAALAYGVFLVGGSLLVRLNIELRKTDEKMYRWALHFTTSAPIHYNLATVLLETGRAAESIPHFSFACSRYPEDPKCNHGIALAYWKLGQRKAAIKLLETVNRQHPTFEPAIQSLRTAKALLHSKQ